MKTSQWALIPLAVISTSAHATAYLTVEQAQRAIFPGASFAATGQPDVWRTSNGGFFVVDRVVGKHEFITMAVGINANGTVKQIEIMDYRESLRIRGARRRMAGAVRRQERELTARSWTPTSRISVAPRCRRSTSPTASNASFRSIIEPEGRLIAGDGEHDHRAHRHPAKMLASRRPGIAQRARRRTRTAIVTTIQCRAGSDAIEGAAINSTPPPIQATVPACQTPRISLRAPPVRCWRAGILWFRRARRGSASPRSQSAPNIAARGRASTPSIQYCMVLWAGAGPCQYSGVW